MIGKWPFRFILMLSGACPYLSLLSAENSLWVAYRCWAVTLDAQLNSAHSCSLSLPRQDWGQYRQGRSVRTRRRGRRRFPRQSQGRKKEQSKTRASFPASRWQADRNIQVGMLPGAPRKRGPSRVTVCWEDKQHRSRCALMPPSVGWFLVRSMRLDGTE